MLQGYFRFAKSDGAQYCISTSFESLSKYIIKNIKKRPFSDSSFGKIMVNVRSQNDYGQ